MTLKCVLLIVLMIVLWFVMVLLMNANNLWCCSSDVMWLFFWCYLRSSFVCSYDLLMVLYCVLLIVFMIVFWLVMCSYDCARFSSDVLMMFCGFLMIVSWCSCDFLIALLLFYMVFFRCCLCFSYDLLWCSYPVSYTHKTLPTFTVRCISRCSR